MNTPQANAGYEPNGEIDMARSFAPKVDLTHDDEDGHSHMSGIPLQLPASANVASNKLALVTFSLAEGDFVRNVPSLHPISSQTLGEILGNHSISQHAPSQSSPAVLGLKMFNWSHNEHVKI